MARSFVCLVAWIAGLLTSAGHAQSTKISGELPREPGGNIFRFEVTSDGGTVVYMADQDVYLDYELYSLPSDGSGAPVRLSGDEGTLGYSPSFVLSPDGTHAAYYAELRTWWVPVDGSAPRIELDTPGPGASMGDTDPFFRISPDNQWLLFWNEGEGGIWGVPTNGGAAQRLDGGAQYVPGNFVFSPDSSRVLYQKNPNFTGFELYSAALDDSGEFSFGLVNVNSRFAPTPDGSRVIFALDGEIFSAPSDGSAPAVDLSSTLAAFDELSFEIASNSRFVVFRGGYDFAADWLWRAPVDGSTQPVRLHRAFTQGAIQRNFQITPDGRWAVFGANSPGVSGLHAAGLDRPAIQRQLSQRGVTVGSAGMGGSHLISPDSVHAVWAQYGGPGQAAELYSTTIDDGSQRHIRPREAPPRLRLAGPFPEDDLFFYEGISADSRTVVYRLAEAGRPRAYGIFSVPLLGGAPPVTLNAPLLAGEGIPDNVHMAANHVVYLGPQEGTTSSGNGLWTVPADGSQAAVELNPMLAVRPPLSDVHRWEISSNGQRTVYLADQDTDGVDELYSVPTRGGATPIKLNGPLAAGGNVDGFRMTADGEYVLFVADGELALGRDVYRVPITGDAGPPQRLTTLGDVTELELGPNGVHAVFLTNTAGSGEVYSLRQDGTSSAVLLSSPTENNGRTYSFSISPDGGRVVFYSDEQTMFTPRFRIYSVPIDASSGPAELTAGIQVGGYIEDDYAISPDGTRVLYRATLPSDNAVDLYSIPIDAGQSSVVLNGTFNPDRQVTRFTISPDSTRVAYLSDELQDQVMEAFSVPLAGGSPVQLNDLPDLSRSTFDVWFAPDSGRVLYRSDRDLDDVIELYSVLATGGSITKVNTPLVAPDSSIDDVTFARNGRDVVFNQRSALGGAFQLHRGSVSGHRPPVPLTETIPGDLSRLVVRFGQVFYLPQNTLELRRVPLGGNGEVVLLSGPSNSVDPQHEFTISPTGNRVVYRADPEFPGTYELYSSRLRSQPLEDETPTVNLERLVR